MRMRNYLGGHGSTFNCSIAQVALQHAAKFVKIVIYDRPTVQCSCIRSICQNQVQVSHSFRLTRLGGQCAYECGSVTILIVPALVLSPPLNCTRMVAHLEINSTRGKNLRKYALVWSDLYMCTDILAHLWLKCTRKYWQELNLVVGPIAVDLNLAV